ncbi:hypothetical protein THAOC_18387 [Thalassiosira oceanica]|uniref:Reverse transcriptase domain-containing protein n=1 Tax=Thalassiosira oceanica TaxID=159749 RepID=K0S7E1_THAOC|nr:hypothetical protein THAOC_18387 [Thalassiosira oceanica]|eukprot:EJK61170.1 hypothetical protein THAOC_18387 [Thalassiosira oceanica]
MYVVDRGAFGPDKPSSRARPYPKQRKYLRVRRHENVPLNEMEACLERLASYLRRPETQVKFTHYHPDALIEAFGLVMRNNRFKFGEVLVKQIMGIAMGMSPAPLISNLYVAIHEEEEVLQYLACNWLLFLKRFIDDGIGIWLHHPDPAEEERRWKELGGLAWVFSKRSNQIDFMDVTISLVDNRVEFKLFEKPLALHLYLPPHSSPLPASSRDLSWAKYYESFSFAHMTVTSMITCQSSLGSYKTQAESLCPLFIKAVSNAENYLSLCEAQRHKIKEEKAEENKRESTSKYLIILQIS